MFCIFDCFGSVIVCSDVHQISRANYSALTASIPAAIRTVKNTTHVFQPRSQVYKQYTSRHFTVSASFSGNVLLSARLFSTFDVIRIFAPFSSVFTLCEIVSSLSTDLHVHVSQALSCPRKKKSNYSNWFVRSTPKVITRTAYAPVRPNAYVHGSRASETS